MRLDHNEEGRFSRRVDRQNMPISDVFLDARNADSVSIFLLSILFSNVLITLFQASRSKNKQKI